MTLRAFKTRELSLYDDSPSEKKPAEVLKDGKGRGRPRLDHTRQG